MRRALDDTPLNRARYASKTPITDLQWLAGSMYEADAAGEVSTWERGDNRTQRRYHLSGGEKETRFSVEARDDDGLRQVIDGYHVSIPSHVADYTPAPAYRLAKVQGDMTEDERFNAKRWLIDKRDPLNSIGFRKLLSRLANLYAAHDEQFEFDAYCHNRDTIDGPM